MANVECCENQDRMADGKGAHDEGMCLRTNQGCEVKTGGGEMVGKRNMHCL